MNYGTMDGMAPMGGWGGMAFGGLMMLFCVALLVGLIVLIARWLGGTSRSCIGPDALDTLKQRFAQGEIDIAECQERSRRLQTVE